ncbi:unnamed protein product [Diplocarpon coronariae]
MAIKAVNNTVGPNGMIPTLLVFRAYLRLTELDPPNPSVEQRVATIKKAMKEVRKIHATRKVNDALGTRDGASNPADAMIKANLNQALQQLIYQRVNQLKSKKGNRPTYKKWELELRDQRRREAQYIYLLKGPSFPFYRSL